MPSAHRTSIPHLLKDLSEKVSWDEADAATCAPAAYMWWRGMCEELGNPEEDVIILPKPGRATIL